MCQHLQELAKEFPLKLGFLLLPFELQVNNLQTDKEKLESYTKKTLHKFQDKYMVAISHCKQQISEKNEKIDYLEVKREEKRG